MSVAEVSPFAARRIEAIVGAALRDAGVLGTIPTPLEALREVARVRALEPISSLPDTVGSSGRALLGAVWFEERIVYVDERQAAPRRRFTEAHELVHALCPWHEAVLREDTERELFRPAVAALEAEANAGAGLLIFQGAGFARRAQAAGPCSAETALALAEAHGASRHATLHHYAQTHPRAVALLTVGRFPRRDGSLPVWRSVESPAFRRRHGSAAAHYPAGLLPGSGLHGLAEAARTSGGLVRAGVRLGDASGGSRIVAEAHYNRHAFLVLLAPAARRGSRVDGRAGPGEEATAHGRAA
jgi:hypothetical protein